MTGPRMQLWANIALRGLWQFLLIQSVLIVFFTARHLSAQDDFLVQVTFIGTLLLLDIPTSILSDVLSRKWALCIASALKGIGGMLLIPDWGFPGIVGAYAVIGVANSLYSGVSGSILYDCAKQQSKVPYQRVLARSYSVTLGCSLLSAIAGSIVAQHLGIEATIIGNAVGAWLCLPIAIAISDAGRVRPERVQEGISLFRHAMLALTEHPDTLMLAKMAIVVGAVPLVAVYFSQMQLQASMAPLYAFGLLAAFKGGIGAALAPIAGRIHLTNRRALSIVQIGLVGGIVALSITAVVWQFVSVLLIGIASLVVGVQVSSAFDQSFSTAYRSTINSMLSVVTRLIVVILNGVIAVVVANTSRDAAILLTLPFLALVWACLTFAQRRISANASRLRAA